LIHVLASLASKKRTLGYSEKMKSKPSSSDVVIGCGRTTVGLCASFKQLQVHERPFTIQIQHPRVPLSLFDAVIIPRHDLINTSRAMRWLGYYHSHVYQTFGTVVDLPQEKLDLAASVWSEKLKLWLTKSKRIVLLVGGPCRGFLFDSKQTQAMIQHLCTALQAIEDVSLLVTFSRRTPLEVCMYVRTRLLSLV
jgi:mitochondrial fission protein ELM1